jgi:hypothetical protein
MWTDPIMALTAIAVPAENLESGREIMFFQPTYHPSPFISGNFPTMLISIIVDMIHGEKFQYFLTATRAFGRFSTTVVSHYSKLPS